MTAQWTQFYPAQLYPQGLVDASDAASDAASTLGAAVNVLAANARIAALYANSVIDLQKELIDATKNLIYSVVQQLLQTGIYQVYHIPGAFTTRMPVSTWLNDVALSFDDKTDAERPILPTKGFVGALVFLGTAPGIGSLLEKLRWLFELFNKLIASESQVKKWVKPGNPWDLEEGTGRAPDWGSITLGEVCPPIGELARVLLAFSEQISAGYTGLLDQFADFLQKKADKIQSIANAINDILEHLRGMLDGDGVWMLSIYGEFDSKDIQRILRSTPGGPRNFKDAYTAGCMFLATGGTSAGALFDLFGVAKKTTELQPPEFLPLGGYS